MQPAPHRYDRKKEANTSGKISDSDFFHSNGSDWFMENKDGLGIAAGEKVLASQAVAAGKEKQSANHTEQGDRSQESEGGARCVRFLTF